MIKFFRQFRQRLLFENRFYKYLLYAIGEIILVVIGILIALQINNWNEEQKEQRQLRSIVSEIKTNLSVDSLAITELIHLTKEDIEIQRKVIARLKDSQPLDSSLNSFYGRLILMRPIKLVPNGYGLLKDLGMDKIQNEELRNKLIQYYEIDLFRIEKNIEDDNIEFTTVLLPYVRHNFESWNYGRGGIPKDYIGLQRDSYFLTSLIMNIDNAQATVRDLDQGLQNIYEILPLLYQLLES